MAALDSTNVHIWAHAGINIDEMYTSSIAQLADRKCLRALVRVN